MAAELLEETKPNWPQRRPPWPSRAHPDERPKSFDSLLKALWSSSSSPPPNRSNHST